MIDKNIYIKEIIGVVKLIPKDTVVHNLMYILIKIRNDIFGRVSLPFSYPQYKSYLDLESNDYIGILDLDFIKIAIEKIDELSKMDENDIVSNPTTFIDICALFYRYTEDELFLNYGIIKLHYGYITDQYREEMLFQLNYSKNTKELKKNVSNKLRDIISDISDEINADNVCCDMSRLEKRIYSQATIPYDKEVFLSMFMVIVTKIISRKSVLVEDKEFSNGALSGLKIDLYRIFYSLVEDLDPIYEFESRSISVTPYLHVDKKELYTEVMNDKGYDHQLKVFYGEVLELNEIILKLMTSGKDRVRVTKNLYEEMIDVFICYEQFLNLSDFLKDNSEYENVFYCPFKLDDNIFKEFIQKNSKFSLNLLEDFTNNREMFNNVFNHVRYLFHLCKKLIGKKNFNQNILNAHYQLKLALLADRWENDKL